MSSSLYGESSEASWWNAQKGREEKAMDLNQISKRISQAAMRVHRELGPGLGASLYRSCMLIELTSMGVTARPGLLLPVYYRGQKVSGEAFRIDALVEDQVIVEVKAVESLQDGHAKPLLTYLRLAKKPLGMLLNFNETVTIRVFPGVTMLQSPQKGHAAAQIMGNVIAEPEERKSFPRAL
jgi:GxxExxY protein